MVLSRSWQHHSRSRAFAWSRFPACAHFQAVHRPEASLKAFDLFQIHNIQIIYKKALGTSSSDFVNASLFQLQGAARLPERHFRDRCQ